MDMILRQIAARQLGAGAKLPSIRDMAGRLNVSKSTVVDAYDRLVAEGTIHARRGSGFYVSPHLSPFSISPVDPNRDRAVDPVWMTRQALNEDGALLKPGCGWLPASWMPEDDMRRALRQVARDKSANLSGYSSPQGLVALREHLARRLADQSLDVSPDQILLTESGTQAIDLLCRYLLEPGDTVLVDDPCYFNFHALLRAHRAKVVGVRRTPSGPDVVHLEDILKVHTPRLYITNSAVHNPTGAVLSPVVAHRMLKLAEQHDLRIIEDDIFADFEDQASPRLAAFDGLDRVMQVSSFSKTLSASVRCGYIAARQDWIDELIDLRLATSFGGGAFSSDLVLSLLKGGAYRRHVSAMRSRLADAMGNAKVKLKALGLEPWMEPSAGMFLWCRLPEGLGAAEVSRHALSDELVLAPGNAFSLSTTAARYMRFNVAQCTDPNVFRYLARAMDKSITH